MKRAFSIPTFVFLSSWLCCSITIMAQDLTSLLQRVEDIAKSKNSSWELTRKDQRDKEVNFQWGSAKDGMRVLIYYGASKEEAEQKMKVSISHLSVGPGDKLTNLGDEAYLWESKGSNFAGARFRKGNVYFEIVAPSSTFVKDMANSLAELVPKAK